MTEHTLKTLAPYWDAVERGEKNFEVCRDDRGFQRGDVLVLRKIERLSGDFAVKRPGGMVVEQLSPTTASRNWRDPEFYDLRRRITYVLTGGQLGIEPGYVVLGLANDDA